MFAAISEELQKGVEAAFIAGAFHRTMAHMISEVCLLLKKAYNIHQVVLSGGVFQNRLLLKLTQENLEKNGFKIYTHSKVPANDGGLSLGQAVMALRKYMDTEATHE